MKEAAVHGPEVQQRHFDWNRIPKISLPLEDLKFGDADRLLDTITLVLAERFPEEDVQDLLLTGVDAVRLMKQKGSGNSPATFATSVAQTRNEIGYNGRENPLEFAKNAESVESNLSAIVVYDQSKLEGADNNPRIEYLEDGSVEIDGHEFENASSLLWLAPGGSTLDDAMRAVILFRPEKEINPTKEHDHIVQAIGRITTQ